jgi:PBSX family phage terminase large subunit
MSTPKAKIPKKKGRPRKIATDQMADAWGTPNPNVENVEKPIPEPKTITDKTIISLEGLKISDNRKKHKIQAKRGAKPKLNKKNIAELMEPYFKMGLSDLDCCRQAGLSHTALLTYYERNPGEQERLAALKSKPTLLARKIVLQAMAGSKEDDKEPDINLAKWWLEKKDRGEFGSDNFVLEKERVSDGLGEYGGRGYVGITADFVAPEFANFFREVKQHKYTHYREPGGRGAGRSSAISLAVIDLIMTHNDIHAIVCRKIGNTLRDSVFTQLQWAIDSLGLSAHFKINRGLLLITRIDTGQQIYFRGLDDPFKVKSIKPPFGYIGILWVEEADQTLGEPELRPVRQSVLRGGEEFWVFESWNTPRNKQHWINERTANEAERENVRTHHSTYLNLPAEWLGQTFFDEAEALKALDENAYRHEYLGEAIGYGGEIFERLSLERISNETIAEFDNVKMGIDWGYTIDPLAFVKVHYDKTRRVLYVFEEMVAHKLTDIETAEILKVRKVTGRDRIFADSADPKSIDNFRRLGFYMQACTKFPGSVEHGVKFLQSLALIVIDPARCPTAAREFAMYSLKKGANNEFVPVINRINDHCVAEGTLITTDQGQVPVENIRRGDLVLTRKGYKPVLSAWCSGENKETLTINCGPKNLVCTPNHRVFVFQRGFVRADELTGAERLRTLNRYFANENKVMHDVSGKGQISLEGGHVAKKVYDLTVADAHEFYANGILVHNCIDATRYSLNDEINNFKPTKSGFISVL